MLVFKQNLRAFLLIGFLPILLFYVTTAAAVEIDTDISTDTIWTASMNPYIIKNNITVLEDVKLIIKQGTEIRFAPSTEESKAYSITVKGTLAARGVAENPVLFTTDESGKYWGSIDFTKDSPSWDAVNATGSIIEFCVLEYGGNTEEDIYEKGIIRLLSSSPGISNNLIRFSENSGIVSYSNTLDIAANKIHNTNIAIRIIGATDGSVINNYLINNSQGISLDTASGSIDVNNNTIYSKSEEVLGSCMGINLNFTTDFDYYLWEQIGGPAVTLSNTTDIFPVFTAPEISQDEELLFQLIVTDRDGLQSADTLSVNVSWKNNVPVSNAGDDQSVSENETVILNGSSSYDPDDGILSYAWEKTSGPEVTFLDANSTSSKHCLFTAPEVDEFGEVIIFQLAVTDKGGLVKKDTIIITIEDTPEATNILPVADAGVEQTVIEGATVTLDGSGSSDSDGSIVSWTWEQTEGTHVDITNPTAPSATFTGNDGTPLDVDVNGETLFFKLTVTDNKGGERSDVVAIKVTDDDAGTPNVPPMADAGDDQDRNENTTVTLDASGSSDSDGSVASYFWTQVFGPTVSLSGNSSSPIRTFKLDNITKDEELIFRLVITDDSGFKSEDTILVTIMKHNEHPAAIAETENTEKVYEGDIVVLNGSGSTDSDGNIDSFLWEQISGSTTITLSDIRVQIPHFTAPEVPDEELYVFRLKVTDNNGYSGYDTVLININPKNDAPTADAGEGQAVIPGTLVTLAGTAIDPDGLEDIQSWLWEQKSGNNLTIYNATAADPHFTAPSIDPGNDNLKYNSLIFQLTVKDKAGLSSTDSVIINIVDQNTSNRVPVANAGDELNAFSGDEVTLSAAASFDPDDASTLNIWNNDFINNDEEELGNSIAVATQKDANSDLSFTTNNFSGPCNFFVYLYNIDSPETNQGSINMTQNWWGTESPDDISSMIYDENHDRQLSKIDYSSFKAQHISEAGSVISYPPMAIAGEDRDEIIETVVTLDASETHDPDNILTYSWSQIEGNEVTLTGADSSQATFTVPTTDEDDDSEEAGTLKFKLTVTDSDNFTGTDEVTITVKVDEEADAAGRDNSGCFISTVSWQ